MQMTESASQFSLKLFKLHGKTNALDGLNLEKSLTKCFVDLEVLLIVP
jgi:hypothetical protein